jgi:hypothetical protein
MMLNRDPIPKTSRLSQSRIEKYLGQGERIVFVTSGLVFVGEHRKRAYVTNLRLLLYRSDGLIVRRDSLDEIDLNTIRRATMTEIGMVIKEYILEIDGMQIRGKRSDVLNLYRVLHTVKATA